ncbi:Npun_R2821/Npun_R2822 family protein [Chroococcus sp. FPU101]|uniref:Npun_R2821/Npun_R2822 family protein n=1 Tax=Chroococcus sp. FPU101 TaxID=1974212 RepID=UPI001A8CA07D|nr:Npun_R2821/Npun_R2822 family protein [Chroococcus sp. FPU101]GFE67403.1 nucleotide-diphospho-sugar transferases superfamily [Chroococcus sp. FPU101]
MDGICTLANDRVFEQLIALLNSIDEILGKDTPVCVYPYDDNTQQIAAEIAKRPNVQLYTDRESIQRWDNFAKAAWDTHPTARERWKKADSDEYHRFGTHRRYCAFDGPFDRFIYMDGDTLAMGPMEQIFKLLDQYDCIVYDFQHKDLTHVYEVASPKLLEVFPQERLQSEIFCSGFYASKKNLFPEEQRNWLIEQLQNGDAEILYPMAPDQTLINYMMMCSGYSIYNLALELPKEEKTGCCVTSPHFTEQDHILYDKGKRLTYFHYIGMSSKIFNRVCAGENIDFSYRDLFLYYRYLSEPENRPQFTTAAKPYQTSLSLGQKIIAKLGFK